MIVHVPRNTFLKLATEQSLARLRHEVRDYPSEVELMHKFVASSLWDTYKQVRAHGGLVRCLVWQQLV